MIGQYGKAVLRKGPYDRILPCLCLLYKLHQRSRVIFDLAPQVYRIEGAPSLGLQLENLRLLLRRKRRWDRDTFLCSERTECGVLRSMVSHHSATKCPYCRVTCSGLR